MSKRFFHSGTLRRRVHPPHLHPYYPPEAGRGSSDHGEPHGADEVNPTPKKQHSAPDGKPNFPAGALRFLRGVGHGVGLGLNAFSKQELFT